MSDETTVYDLSKLDRNGLYLLVYDRRYISSAQLDILRKNCAHFGVAMMFVSVADVHASLRVVKVESPESVTLEVSPR